MHAWKFMTIVTALLLLAAPGRAQTPPDDASAPPPLISSDTRTGALSGQQDGQSTNQSTPNPAAAKFITIHTGSTSGIYYRVGGALCQALFKKYHETDIHCTSVRSRGSRDNLEILGRGEGMFAIIQPERSLLPGGKNPLKTARAVMSLHAETGVLVVNPESGIRSLGDLRGKIVDLGSTERETVDRLLETQQIRSSDFTALQMPSVEGKMAALCNHDIDAFMIWIGHPAPALTKLIQKCGAGLVGLWVPGSEAVIRDAPYLSHQEIKQGVYPNMSASIETIGPHAVLIAESKLDDDLVYKLVQAVFENFDAFTASHPALNPLTRETAVNEGNFLPFHPGALRYYREQGLLRNLSAE